MKSNLELMQNVVKPYIDAKNQALTNYVTDTGVKNLLPYPWTGEKDEQGITYTVSNEVLSANGTNTNNSYYRFRAKTDTPFLANGDYIFSVDLTGTYPADATLEVITRTSPDASPSHNYNTVLGTGNHVEVPFSINNDNYIVVQIFNGAGKTYTNATIKPMIRLASITDSTYAPYAKTNVELTQQTGLKQVYSQNVSNVSDPDQYLKRVELTVTTGSRPELLIFYAVTSAGQVAPIKTTIKNSSSIVEEKVCPDTTRPWDFYAQQRYMHFPLVQASNSTVTYEFWAQWSGASASEGAYMEIERIGI